VSEIGLRSVILLKGSRDGHHLWNRVASLRALQAGSLLAERLNDTGAAEWYLEVSKRIEKIIPDFWKVVDKESGMGYWQATTYDDDQEYRPNRTGLDCALPLTVIHGGLERGEGNESQSGILDAAEPGILASLREYITSFQDIYTINAGAKWTDGWAVGRYMEDAYDGVGTSKGNPWRVACYLHQFR
jgi:glucoamylase